jgi:hypothetical protein
VISLPTKSGREFEVALAGGDGVREQIRACGWKLADPRVITASVASYLEFLAGSRGEFSVAVNLEVKSRSGWFSDRTAAYLASGKPVVVQDTGFPERLPCGEGIFAFGTLDEAVECLAEIERDYARHCRAARSIAETHFDSDRVLGSLLARAGIGTTGLAPQVGR